MERKRFAGGVNILEQQQQLIAQMEADTAKRRAEDQQRMAEQTERDVAAAYGQIIPFT